MADLFFETALLPDGWGASVRVSVDPSGTIVEVKRGAASTGDCVVVRGAAVPGVPNLHSHAFQRALAGWTERGSPHGDTFWSWRERMYAFLGRLDPEDVESIASQLYIELVRHGYTSVTEFHYLRNDRDGRPYADPLEMARALMRAADRAGIGLTLLPVLYQNSDFGGREPGPGQRRFVARVDDLLHDIQTLRSETLDRPDRRVGLALHSLRAVAPEALRDAVQAVRAADPDAPIHIHVAEQVAEVEACLAWSGARPVDWLLDHADVDARWCAIHATHMTPDETRRLARSGAVAGLCPTTEANLGDGVFPFSEYTAEDGRWGLGTDSHVSVSPVADARLLEYGQRLIRRERNVAAGRVSRSTGRALLDGAWAGGAQASGRPIGTLASGHRADVVVLDRDHPSMVGREGDDLLDAWVFSGEDPPVREVFLGGRSCHNDVRRAEEERITQRYRSVLTKLSR